MQIFLDSANVSEIKKYVELGVVDGITTNPSLMAKVGGDFLVMAKNICDAVAGDVSLEVAANHYEEMLQEGSVLLAIASNVVIKLPITQDGIRACKYFVSKGIKTNMTLCFSVSQAILAAKAGATYVSPFIGRLQDVGKDGVALVQAISSVYKEHKVPTKILAASIRNVEHVEAAYFAGANAVTLPGGLVDELFEHELTRAGLQKFNEDWAKSGMKII